MVGSKVWFCVFIYVGVCKGDGNVTVTDQNKLLDSNTTENVGGSEKESVFTVIPAVIVEEMDTGKNETNVTSDLVTTTTLKPFIVTSQTVNLTGILPYLENITVSSTTRSAPEFPEMIVTSQPVLLKESVIDALLPSGIQSQTKDNESEPEETYKTKTPPVYHPYIEEIVDMDDADTTTEVYSPIRLKSTIKSNEVTIPYGPVSKFAEKELNKIRLNHWVIINH